MTILSSLCCDFFFFFFWQWAFESALIVTMKIVLQVCYMMWQNIKNTNAQYRISWLNNLQKERTVAFSSSEKVSWPWPSPREAAGPSRCGGTGAAQGHGRAQQRHTAPLPGSRVRACLTLIRCVLEEFIFISLTTTWKWTISILRPYVALTLFSSRFYVFNYFPKSKHICAYNKLEALC